ncbi:FkbM family methyltransferase [Egicoccus halophilus]|uniref:Putative methyltransferase n=1 Tax=Egicoccus halophilus TaxID=1670830 RepID=A0A8J3EUP6_9ACTN|nr:FkbM family methyltransferase [Egicoccus halophilus]GGI08114.1 putative methyltransferase [Egicoccus halophilus]
MAGPARDDRSDDGRPSPLERAVDRIPFLEKELFLLRRLVRPGQVCLDVGAAGGAHLLVMAAGVGPTGRVLGFEPRPGSLSMLRRLVRMTRLDDRVRLYQVALSDAAGTLPLRIPVVPTRAHFHGSAPDRSATAAFARLPHREIVVPTRRLDDVVTDEGLERVDLLKCDVEGAELKVLAGAAQVLQDHRPLVVLEADDLHQARENATGADVLAAVAAHGYRVYRYRRGALETVDGPVPGEDDYLFVPEERPAPVAVRR